MKKKVELLAPAGNYESFIGALNAGADAVYIGGQKFGARAFADNFTEEEVCRAVSYAHLFEKKVYLTLNTLVKESEMTELYDYLAPFYEAGLDGVIVQDIGVLAYVKRQFPDMELHISTQMTLTGKYGAKAAKEMGAVRIVPARELSLEEIETIKQEVDIEIETFIHGALCYCYSGQCLFSSILGGRSGNRGKCAQPCRLPYQKDNLYPLSLKDLCTVHMIPKLLEAGIDSFKIEGRMKKPEYAAGVTAVYRKYIDRYYENPSREFAVEKEDLDRLKALYLRSGQEEGYYRQHNGRHMITLDRPGYGGSDESLMQEIRAKYLEKTPVILLEGKAVFRKGAKMSLSIQRNGMLFQAEGETVMQAENRPAAETEVRKQLMKTGNTEFAFEKLTIEMDEDCFIPVKAVNELRREALAMIRMRENRKPAPRLAETENAVQTEGEEKQELCVEVASLEQYHSVCGYEEAERIYVPIDLLDKRYDEIVGAASGRLYAALPHILRKRSYSQLKRYEELLKESKIEGALIRNLEEMEWLAEIGFHKKTVADANMYVWNKEAAGVLEAKNITVTLPHELREKELRQLGMENREMIVYGRIPMMISANCTKKTLAACDGKPEFSELKDRYQKKFPVFHQCEHCYNVIYNSVPLLLYTDLNKIKKQGVSGIRLVFTQENSYETKQVMDLFIKRTETLQGEYTKGHFKRGVE